MNSFVDRIRAWLGKGTQLATSPRGRRIGWIAIIVIVAFGIVAWLGVPPLLRSVATHQLSDWLERPVTVGEIRFNPYLLKLDVEQLHIGERGSDQPFVDIGRLSINASWSSLFRDAAILDALVIDQPQFRIVRTAEQRFNFTDLIEKANTGPKSDKPARFALHNIEIHGGSIYFDDQVLHAQHRIEQLQLGVPFIANLPSATQINVQPLLQMTVDGSPFGLSGKTRPFAATHESVVDFKLGRFDLTRYLAYVPVQLPVQVPKGLLSANLQVHFIDTQPQVLISLSGDVALDQLQIHDRKDAPLLDLKHAGATLVDVQPLRNIVHLGSLAFDGLTTYAALNRDGSTNFQALQSNGNTAAAPQKSAQPADPFDLSIASLKLDNGALQLTDRRSAMPATLTVDDLHLKLLNLQTRSKIPATAELGMRLAGGTLEMQSKFVPSAQQATATVALNQINLATFQPFIKEQLAGAIKSGVLDGQAQVQADFSENPPKLQVQQAAAAIDQFELRAADGHEVPLRWQRLQVKLDLLDITNSRATLSEVRSEGLNLLLRREQGGVFNLAQLLHAQTPAKPSHASPTKTPDKAWQVAVGTIALDKAAIHFADESTPSPVKLEITPLNLSLHDVSSDLSKPFKLDLNGDFLRKGHFQVTGNIAPSPLKAELQIVTQQLDLAAFEPYIPKLNATIASAALSMRGRLKLASVNDQLQVHYRGDATLGKVRVLDKLTDDDFAHWNALSATGIKVAVSGTAPPKVSVDAIALSDFYARIIMSSGGKLNLQDIVAKAEAAPTSLTRDEPQPSTGVPPATVQPAAAPAATGSQTVGADIALGQITLQSGNINYTDNFIKPNYTANISNITGKVGAFGTQTTAPADVVLQAQFDHNAPIAISGSINPLAPMAIVDIKAKADSVELTDLTSYSAKYAGYPLTKGKLSFDVRYQLDQGKLTADNHIYIDQLTFGDHVDSPDATKLPVQLAVALLKDSNGVIDLHVPVSGSVSDPDFSLGGVILHAFLNLIAKAALSPFSLLSSAFGGGDALSYITFDPGSAALTAEGTQHLDALVKALKDRPALRMDIIGRVDPELDTPGLRETMVAQRVKKQMIRDTVGKGESVDIDNLQVPPETYDKYLERAYKAESFAKPKNFVGLAKTLPPEEMKKLMITNMIVSNDDLRHLADQRAEAVHQWLNDKVDATRLFVVAPKLDAHGIDDKGKTTRVDFSLK
jgi:hypothetical protein